MESEASRRSRGPPSAPFRRLTRPSKGTPKTTIRAFSSGRSQAMKRGETGRMASGRDRPRSVLDEVLFAQERDGRQRAANALDGVLGGEDAHLVDRLAADAKGFV